MAGSEKTLFSGIVGPVGHKIDLWEEIWTKKITVKHPDMKGREKDVEETIKNPLEVHENPSKGRTNLLYLALLGQLSN